jgi:hypothetical protein
VAEWRERSWGPWSNAARGPAAKSPPKHAQVAGSQVPAQMLEQPVHILQTEVRSPLHPREMWLIF